MEALKKQVADVQSRWDVASTKQVDFYTSSVGQHYAILGIWYCVRLFVEVDHSNYPLTSSLENILINDRNIAKSDCFSWKGVEKLIANIKTFFNKPNCRFYEGRQLLNLFLSFDHYFIRVVPKDYASDPEKYLKRGDIIATPFVAVARHTGIYLGDGKVGHVSGHRGGKAASVARIGRLVGDFVFKGTESIWVVCLPLRIRSGEEIARKAEELAAKKFRDGAYNILLRNCQHFAFLCATGVQYGL